MSEADPAAQQALERVLADPAARARLAQALASELPQAQPQAARWRPFLAGLASGAVAVFAFLLPSVQEQWTLYKTQSAVDRYAAIGESLMRQSQYQAAEQAYSRALELAGGQRIDLLQGQLRAHVQRLNDDVHWPGEVPDDIGESDFVYLLELQTDPAQVTERAATLTVYGAWLAGQKRYKEAQTRLEEALSLAPHSVSAHLNLGNLHRDMSDNAGAEAEYRKAIALDADEPSAHYDLGLLLEETGRQQDAEAEFRRYIALAPGEDDARKLAGRLKAR